MPEDFTDTWQDLSGTSDNELSSDGDSEGSLSHVEGEVQGDAGDEQQAQHVMLNPAPDANTQELRKVCLSVFFLSLGHHHT